MGRPAKTSLPALPDGAIVARAERKNKSASGTDRVLAAYLKLLEVIEQHGSGFAFPHEENPTGNTRITYNNTLAEQSFYHAIQLADYEIPLMLRGNKQMIEAKRAAIMALLERIKED